MMQMMLQMTVVFFRYSFAQKLFINGHIELENMKKVYG